MSVEPLIAAHVFAKLRAIWGTRFIALWRGAELDEVLATWDEALRGVSRDRIARALIDCQNADKPPTLPEFLALCRAQHAPDEAPRQLMFTGAPTEREQARENLRRIRRMLAEIGRGRAARDPMFWAKHPMGAAAVALLVRGARTDWRLAQILRQHVETAGENCRAQEACEALLAFFDSEHGRAFLAGPSEDLAGELVADEALL